MKYQLLRLLIVRHRVNFLLTIPINSNQILSQIFIIKLRTCFLSDSLCLFSFLGRIPRLSLIQHSLYVGVVGDLLSHHSKRSSMEKFRPLTGIKPVPLPSAGFRSNNNYKSHARTLARTLALIVRN